MPSLVPPHSFYNPLHNEPGRSVDRLTGNIAVASTGGDPFVAIGGTAVIPADVVALAVYATIDVTYDCRCWANFFGSSYATLQAVISLFNNRTDQSQILKESFIELASYSAWIGSYGSGPRTTTASLRCDADWGTPYGAPSQWTILVSLRALVGSRLWAGASASASTTVTRIDYELFWPS
jgi:hypothetical protein